MRISFVDISGDYNALSPTNSPLGGTESAICYLASALTTRGHEVSIINKTSTPGVFAGVYCLNLDNSNSFNIDYLNTRDAVICSNAAFLGKNIKSSGVKTPLLFWTGHDTNQPAVISLQDKEISVAWDQLVLVSEWQSRKYENLLGIDKNKISVIQNAIGKPFEIHRRKEPFFFETNRPPILVYASAPHRGLFVLLKAFPYIRSAIPGTTLRVYSSMQMYGVAPENDQFKILYDKCISTEGVEYYGSVNQVDLSIALNNSDILSYPNTFEETSCISLMQSMACGCLPIFNNFGALAETAAGFGKVLETPHSVDSDEFVVDYAKFLISIVLDSYDNKDKYRSNLDKQTKFIFDNYTWPTIAARWETTIAEIAKNKS